MWPGHFETTPFKRADLEIGRQVPQPSESSDLHAQDELQALEVMEAGALSVIYCAGLATPCALREAGRDARFGSALLRFSFFLPDLRVRLRTAWGPSSVTSVVSFL